MGKRIKLYRHSGCPKCARYARTHHKLDWFDRFEDSTEIPPSGALKMGEIVVEDLASGKFYHGVESIRLLCRHIPLYYLFLPLTYIPLVQRAIDKETQGCSV